MRLFVMYSSNSVWSILQCGCHHGQSLFVSIRIKRRKYRRFLWRPRASLVVGGTFRTAHQHRSTRFQWFVDEFNRASLRETVWFHRGQISQQTHQHLRWRRSDNQLCTCQSQTKLTSYSRLVNKLQEISSSLWTVTVSSKCYIIMY